MINKSIIFKVLSKPNKELDSRHLVKVRCEADHKNQNMVVFDGEESEAAVLFLRAK